MPETQYSPLTAYRITCECGYTWDTCMAAHVDLEMAEQYFLNNEFLKPTKEGHVGGAAVGLPDLEDWKVKPVKVEKLK